MNDHSKPKIGDRVVDRGGDGVIVQTYERDGVGECFVVRWDSELPDFASSGFDDPHCEELHSSYFKRRGKFWEVADDDLNHA
jgi:hypothetical protein